MGTSIALAAGLNPYVTALFVFAFAGMSSRVQLSGPFAQVDPVTWRVAVGVAVVLGAIDLTVGKLRPRFPLLRRASLGAAAVVGGSGAAIGVGDAFDAPTAAACGTVLASVTSIAVTRVARAALEGGAWLHLGHIPVMMAGTVVAAISVPLTLAFGWPGTAIAGAAAAAYAIAAARSLRRRPPAGSASGS